MLPLRFLSKRNFTYAAGSLHTKGVFLCDHQLEAAEEGLAL